MIFAQLLFGTGTELFGKLIGSHERIVALHDRNPSAGVRSATNGQCSSGTFPLFEVDLCQCQTEPPISNEGHIVAAVDNGTEGDDRRFRFSFQTGEKCL